MLAAAISKGDNPVNPSPRFPFIAPSNKAPVLPASAGSRKSPSLQLLLLVIAWRGGGCLLCCQNPRWERRQA